jgi:hypothetical protein
MKKRMVSLLLALVMVLTMLPIGAMAAANSITITDAQYYDSGALKSATAQFGWDTAAATGRMVLQTKFLRSAVSGFPYGDFTDKGPYGSSFQSFDEVLAYDTAKDKFGIIAWSDESNVGVNPSNSATFNFEASDMPLPPMRPSSSPPTAPRSASSGWDITTEERPTAIIPSPMAPATKPPTLAA